MPINRVTIEIPEAEANGKRLPHLIDKARPLAVDKAGGPVFFLTSRFQRGKLVMVFEVKNDGSTQASV